ncbi:MAG: hypothetical protein H6816_10680 [Phycisphaerales bacterium]|nr:hypothetical protein [Phycisphaerales bacterium]
MHRPDDADIEELDDVLRIGDGVEILPDVSPMPAEMSQFSRDAWHELAGVVAAINSSPNLNAFSTPSPSPQPRIMNAEASSVPTPDRRREKVLPPPPARTGR